MDASIVHSIITTDDTACTKYIVRSHSCNGVRQYVKWVFPDFSRLCCGN